MPVEQQGIGRYAMELLQRLENSRIGDDFSRHARRRGLEMGKDCREDWEKKVRLLLLVRGRQPDDMWLMELNRLRTKWSQSGKNRVKGFVEFLERTPWLDPRATAVWIRENWERLHEPVLNLPDPQPFDADRSTMKLSPAQQELIRPVQAAFLSGLLEAILTRSVERITTPASEETL